MSVKYKKRVRAIIDFPSTCAPDPWARLAVDMEVTTDQPIYEGRMDCEIRDAAAEMERQGSDRTPEQLARVLEQVHPTWEICVATAPMETIVCVTGTPGTAYSSDIDWYQSAREGR